MHECVPDSQDEGSSPIPRFLLNKHKLAQSISLLPDDIRRNLRLQSQETEYTSLFTPDVLSGKIPQSPSSASEPSSESDIDLIDIPDLINGRPSSRNFHPPQSSAAHRKNDRISEKDEISARRIEGQISVSDESHKANARIIDGSNATGSHEVNASRLEGINEENHEEKEDADILRQFLDSTNYTSYSRRGLRKRNFASTHPYLTDQAQYLGLCEPDRLNELYDGSPDIQSIVKFLNKIYLRRKEQYPHEDRFRPKNFYSFISKGSKKRARDDPANKDTIPSSPKPNSQNFVDSYDKNADSDNYESAASELSEAELIHIPHRAQVHPVDDDEFDNGPSLFSHDTAYPADETALTNFDFSNDSDSDIIVAHDDSADTDHESDNKSQAEEDNAFVRVGGRYRKMKSVLRGALPESAKRLDSWVSKKKQPRRKTKVIQSRKGLAVKKYGSSGAQNRNLEMELKSFVDDETYYNEDQYLHQSILPFEALNDSSLEFNAANYELRSPEQFPASSDDSSNSESEPEELTPFHASDSETIEYLHNDSNIQELQDVDPSLANQSINDSDGSVIEEDRINPLFAYENSHSSKQRTYKKKSGTKRALDSNTRKSSNMRAPNSSISKSYFHSGTNQITRKRKRGTARTTKDPRVFGELPKKKMKRNPNDANRRIKQSSLIPQHPQYKKSPIDVLQNNYHFRRDPSMFTTAFEAEGDPKPLRSHLPRKQIESRLDISRNFWNMQHREIFPSDFITQVLDFEKIETIENGHSFSSLGDAVFVQFLGHHFSLSLVNKMAAREASEKLLLQLRKVILDPKMNSNESIIHEAYDAIKGLLRWCLILQERPSDKSWRILQSILHEYSQLKDSNNVTMCMIFHPHFLFAYYIFLKLTESFSSYSGTKDMRIYLEKYKTEYWCNFFQFYDLEDLKDIQKSTSRIKLYHWEALGIMYMLSRSVTHGWWNSINEAIWSVISFKAHDSSILSMLYILASLVPSKNHNWSCFRSWYQKFQDNDNSDNHNAFLDITYLLNQRLHWPLEERLVTDIYSVMTKRRFANFLDEPNSPELLEVVRTQDDLPDTCFFDRFMQFLYHYVSSLPLEANFKRLMSKLVTSSQYHYEKSQAHFAMYVNRLNLILLLSQISDLDLSHQINGLLEQVAHSSDLKIFKSSLEGLETFTDISISKRKNFPTTSFKSFFKIFNEFYDSVPNFHKLWKKFTSTLERLMASSDNYLSILLSVISEVEIKRMPEPMTVFTVKYTLSIVKRLILLKLSPEATQMKALKSAEANIISLLDFQMGRFPLSNQMAEPRVIKIVELCIQTWVSLNSLTETNCNIMLLQKFPYMGNSTSRERFVLFLYHELLAFTNLQEHLDTLTVIVLRNLTLHDSSPYLFTLIASLDKQKSYIFDLRNIFIPGNFSEAQIYPLKRQIVIGLITNIKMDSSLSKTAKVLYLDELVRTLDTEYNRWFADRQYVEFCKRIVESLYRNGKETLYQNHTFWGLSSKLGLDYNKYELEWRSVPLKQKLSIVHKELNSALHFNQNAITELSKFLTWEFNDVMYQLFYTYLNALANKQNDKWSLIYHLLKFVADQHQKLKVSAKDSAYISFIQQLLYLQVLMKSCEPQSPYKIFQMRVMCLVFTILRDSYVIHDGFKDQSKIYVLIKKCVAISEHDSVLLEYPMKAALYSLAEIQSPDYIVYNPLNLNEQPQSTEETNMHSFQQLFQIATFNTESVDSSETTLKECLPLDVEFDVL